MEVFIEDVIVSTSPKLLQVETSLATDQNSKHPIIAP